MNFRMKFPCSLTNTWNPYYFHNIENSMTQRLFSQKFYSRPLSFDSLRFIDIMEGKRISKLALWSLPKNFYQILQAKDSIILPIAVLDLGSHFHCILKTLNLWNNVFFFHSIAPIHCCMPTPALYLFFFLIFTNWLQQKDDTSKIL